MLGYSEFTIMIISMWKQCEKSVRPTRTTSSEIGGVGKCTDLAE